MRHSTILKRCEKVRLLIDRFNDFFFESESSIYGSPIVTFRYNLNQKFIGESEISDIESAKKMLGACYFAIDYKSSLILFFYN